MMGKARPAARAAVRLRLGPADATVIGKGGGYAGPRTRRLRRAAAPAEAAWLERCERILAGEVRPDDYLPVPDGLSESVAE